MPKPGQWAAQVSLDIHTERLQRRDVEDLGPLSTTVADQLIDCVKERRQGLAAAGGSHHQGVLAGRDDGPGACCAAVGAAKAAGEPGAHEVTESAQRPPDLLHPCSVPQSVRHTRMADDRVHAADGVLGTDGRGVRYRPTPAPGPVTRCSSRWPAARSNRRCDEGMPPSGCGPRSSPRWMSPPRFAERHAGRNHPIMVEHTYVLWSSAGRCCGRGDNLTIHSGGRIGGVCRTPLIGSQGLVPS